MIPKRSFFITFVSSSMTVACSAMLGLEPLEFDGTSPATNDAGGRDGAGSIIDGTPSAADVAVAVEASVEACLARKLDESIAVFAAVGGDDVADCGSRAKPCKSIATALARATASSKSTLYVAAGTYTGSVAIDRSIVIEGSFAASPTSWLPDCGPSGRTVVEGLTSAPHVLSMSAGNVTLRHLELRSPPAVSAASSTYGIFVKGPATEVTLDHVVVEAGAGGAGADGAPGASGSPPGGSCPPEDGAAGARGGVGAPGPSPAMGPDGFSAGTGGSGAPGTRGGHGTPGGPAMNGTNCVACQGQGIPCTTNPVTVSSQPGTSGCGGGGGLGAGGGGPGGSSVAAFVWEGKATFRHTVLRAGKGGDGGRGGTVGLGAEGSDGAQGNQAYCYTTCSPSCFPSGETIVPGGAKGGRGGTGGLGGRGGGGAGGHSFALVKGPSALLFIEPTTTLAFATGGIEGAPNGVPGQAAERHP